jgi:cell fate (sporulation/competence/biofilm development) regulator YmcA (YheA/YmcA/DUF963 family)
MQVLVFKTNLTNGKHVDVIGNSLNVHPAITKWNVDLQDCDNILRVVANDIDGKEVETMFLNAGYYCEELE